MPRYHRPDPAELKDAAITRGTLKRAWSFARPYRTQLILYLVTIVLGTIVGVLPPLIFKQLIDKAIPQKDHQLLILLVGAAAALTLTQTLIGLVNRWFSSRIGEGLIYDLRTELYDHVQRMPIAFFTRTQTGSLLSRLSNDVLGAQQAIGTVASVLSDVFTLIITLGVMLRLSWTITLLSLVVVPAIIVLDRRLGRRPRRPAHVAGELRAGVRGARRALHDHRGARRHPARRAGRPHRSRGPLVPLPGTSRRLFGLAGGRGRSGSRGGAVRLDPQGR